MTNKHTEYKNAKITLQQEFINYVRNYDGAFTCLNDMSRWMKGFRAFDEVKSAGDFRQVMKDHPDFEDRDLYKVKRAYVRFLEDTLVKQKMTTQMKS